MAAIYQRKKITVNLVRLGRQRHNANNDMDECAYTGDDFTAEDARAELGIVCVEMEQNEFTFIDGSTLTI